MKVYSEYFSKQYNINDAELIGQGNFAQVYKIYDNDLQTYLALRRVDCSKGEQQDIKKQKDINEELRKVESQHILKIYDIIESTDRIWYVTEFCEGGSLWDALNQCVGNKMNERDALEIIYRVSKGVKELHNFRITHRDLKPENILLGSRYVANKQIPVIKIADFGLSTQKIIMETIAGTKQYIAPQQARFHNYTNAVDVWSLGIIFDQILHGSPFYVGENNKEVFQKILKNPYYVRDEGIRKSIQELLLSLLKKKAYQRPIIGVICQNIEKILDQIKKQVQSRSGAWKKFNQFHKKLIKSQNTINNESSLSKIPSLQIMTNFSMDDVIQSYDVSKMNKTLINNTPVEFKGKIEERRAKTPFKRQNGRPQLLRQSIQDNLNLSSSIGNSTYQILKIKQQKMQIKEQKLVENKQILNEKLIDLQKINIYRVDKKKIPTQPPKNGVQSKLQDINEYMVQIIDTKNQLLQSSITRTKQRQFIPNTQLNSSQMPQKFDGSEIMAKFRSKFRCLNYVSTNKQYEEDLYNCSNNLKMQSENTQKQIQEYKKKIKISFLQQIQHFVDSYIDKALK